MDEYLGALLSADMDFLLLNRTTTLKAKQSSPNTPTQVVKTIYFKINDQSTPPLNLHQSHPAHLTGHDKTIFPRPPTLLFSNTSAGVPLAQKILETQLQSQPPQISTFRLPIMPKSTKVKPSTVTIQSNPTSVPIVQPKPSNPTSSLTAGFTNASHGISSQLYIKPQPNTIYASQHQWTILSNHTLPPSTSIIHYL